MKSKWKILILVASVLVIGGAIFAAVHYNNRGVVKVQTGEVTRQNLTALVTASGEIKPRNYINIGANTAGPARITELAVVEGQQVGKGQLLARLESVQPEAEVAAQRASVSSAEAEAAASESAYQAAAQSLRTAQASVDRANAELERARLSFERAKELHEERLISQQEFDQRRSEFQALSASVREAEARREQAEAERARLASSLEAARKRVFVAQANLDRASDMLQRTYAISPIQGMVTNLPVRVGETVVPGIQNSPASLIMTIADMSLITAEVKVDETDIVNVALDQPADITIDAMPDRVFKGRVIEIGNTAILRSTGLAASQSAVSSQEAKDFKVVIALDGPPPEIRPGLSCTAKITTATRNDVLTIPIQALTVRQKGDLLAPADKKKRNDETPELPEEERKKELQGVFLVENEKAVFREVETGITGATNIEVLGGLEQGQQIITGSYKVIRTIRNEARVKIADENAAEEES